MTDTIGATAHTDPAFPGSYTIRLHSCGNIIATGHNPAKALAMRLREEGHVPTTGMHIVFVDGTPDLRTTIAEGLEASSPNRGGA
jgi:hypothetical protein